MEALRKITFFLLCIFSLYSNESTSKRLVVVLGMHRSGTSLVSKGLQTLGVDFGDHLLPGGADNPLGFYEDIDIGSFNETVLYLLKLASHSIKNYPSPIPNQELFIKHGSQLVNEKTKGKGLFGFKDPRTARNMSLWKEIFSALSNTHVQIVLIVRNPISIAKSLYTRNKIDHIRSYYLWLQYYISALSNVGNFEIHFISYENLVQNPFIEMKNLGEKLGLEWTPHLQERLKEFSKCYVDPSMEHHQSSMRSLSKQQNLPLDVKLLYQKLISTCHDEKSKTELLALTQEIEQKLIDIDPLLTYIDKVQQIGECREYRFFDLQENLISHFTRESFSN